MIYSNWHFTESHYDYAGYADSTPYEAYQDKQQINYQHHEEVPLNPLYVPSQHAQEKPKDSMQQLSYTATASSAPKQHQSFTESVNNAVRK